MRSSRPMRCSTADGLPRQVVEHEPMAELEVAPLAAGFGRDEDARPVVGAEPRDLDVAPRRRQLLVEDAAGELRARAERLAQHLERLAVGHEHERLLARRAASASPASAATRGADRRDPSPRPAAAARSRPARAPPSAPRRRPAPVGRDRSHAARATAILTADAPASRDRARTSDACGVRRRRQVDRRPARAAAGRRCPRAASSWCTAAAARRTRAAPRHPCPRETPPAAAAAAAGRTRARRLRAASR